MKTFKSGSCVPGHTLSCSIFWAVYCEAFDAFCMVTLWNLYTFLVLKIVFHFTAADKDLATDSNNHVSSTLLCTHVRWTPPYVSIAHPSGTSLIKKFDSLNLNHSWDARKPPTVACTPRFIFTELLMSEIKSAYIEEINLYWRPVEIHVYVVTHNRWSLLINICEEWL